MEKIIFSSAIEIDKGLPTGKAGANMADFGHSVQPVKKCFSSGYPERARPMYAQTAAG
jgi:hypothetical protein